MIAKRNRAKQTRSLEVRLMQFAEDMRVKAQKAPEGSERKALLQRAPNADQAIDLERQLVKRFRNVAGYGGLAFMTDVKCKICQGLGWVCENHPDKAWTEGEGQVKIGQRRDPISERSRVQSLTQV